ncbi:ATP-dependent RNA helicase SUPV3L1/SUV3 [Bacillus sp. SORGH_AS 510]|uniref:DEAD/DEAH box helicase n=1 Tax=Bacillus sp. SORGH_AS_0510 TaxID=3041771 RepID=UPI00277F33DA|nr:DEAD/DEAH box helicase [Bacillus sp. SORGH_AS_0510]MDQ1145611.1 ATP-dependent RNA helicase SUPV3L1/SUV3 [Bacillus sp. SORGH_AS_0510]
MSKLLTIYPQAIEHTKIKIQEDMDRYLETKDLLPSFEQYLTERSHYIEQIWVNVWLNKSTNDVPKNEKKSYLSEKGYEIQGIDRKLINKLFRDEMRMYQPFDALAWVKETYVGKEEMWEKGYHHAKENYFRQQEQKQLEEEKQAIRMEIEEAASDIIEQNYEWFYLNIRYFVARQLRADIENNTKFQEVDTFALEEKLVGEGRFNPASYTTVATFFKELTGDIHKTLHWGRSFYEYQTYFFVYESLISDYLTELIPQEVLKVLSPELKNRFLDTAHEQLTASFVKGSISQLLYDVEGYFIEDIQEEYLSDLIKLVDIPFDSTVHKEILEKDIQAREKKKIEEEEELKRKKETEERMMKDIFGAEYDPSLNRHIRYVLHIGETNTGKTHHALEKMKEASSGLYLAPLRLLALEVYDKLNSEGIPCSLKTGEEEKIVSDARHISCTVEMFHEKEFYEVVVIDEAQMITDKDRGFSWYKAITKANAEEVHIIGSRNSKSMLLQLLGDSDIEVNEYSRDTPLEVEKKEFHIKHVKKGDALICFSRRRVLETASRLQNDGHSVSMIYGSMPPETRKKQIEQFINGRTKVIVATDAIGMGLNLPIRRIVFLENEKFDGTRRRLLTSQEVKQIAGRAGRKGIYDVGKVAFTADIKKMRNLLLQEDEPVHTFAIAPTNSVFEKFQRYYHDLGTFFELWEKFESPKGTKKASLSEEKALYHLIAGTEIEARLSLLDLYGFLHLPFSKNEQVLIRQWEDTMYSIIHGLELPEPIVKERSLEELELSYKAIGLHLLFLYRLGERTEAIYWERLREEVSDRVQDRLKTEIKKFVKKCKNCGKKLPWDHAFPTCDACHAARYRKYKYGDNL